MSDHKIELLSPILSIGTVSDAPNKDEDLMWIVFKLCHEGANANGDYFTREILQRYYQTAQRKLIDWEHQQPVIGFIDKAELKEEPDGRLYVECTGYIWKYVYRNLAQSIADNYSTGNFRVSMEVWYRNSEYWLGDGDDKQVFTEQEAIDRGLVSYVGREFNGKPVYHVFTDPIVFGGAGIVKNPADEDAWILQVAAQRRQNALEEYHTFLHELWEKENSPIPDDEIVKEHRWVHKALEACRRKEV